MACNAGHFHLFYGKMAWFTNQNYEKGTLIFNAA